MCSEIPIQLAPYFLMLGMAFGLLTGLYFALVRPDLGWKVRQILAGVKPIHILTVLGVLLLLRTLRLLLCS